MVDSWSASRPIGLVVLLLLVFPASVSSAAEPSPTCGRFIAHRGEHSRWTENTWRAMEAAVEVGADYVEVDIRETKDSVLVLMHDRTIDRTTTSTGRVADMTFERLRRATLNDGTHITTLRRDLRAVMASNIQVMLEIKSIRTRRGYASLTREIEQFGVERVTVTSFKARALDKLHERMPQVRRSILTARSPSLAQAKTYGSASVYHRKLTEDWLEKTDAAGLPVYAWTLNSKEAWSRWNGRVAAITTDRAITFDKWRRTASCP